MASCASSSARRHRAGHGVRAPAERPARQLAAQQGRVGHDAAVRGALGIDPRRRRGHLDLFGAGGRQPLGQHLRGRRPAQSEDDRGRVRRGEAGVAEQVVERGHRRRAGSRQPDRGSASTGQPAAAASACTASGIARPGPGHDHAPLLVEAGRQRVELVPVERGPAADRLVPRPPVGPSGRQVAGPAHERVPEGQVEVDRARPRSRGVGQGAGHERAPPGGHRRVRRTGVGGVAHGRAVEAELVDGLGRGHLPQLGRAVGGADDQRDLGLVGLDHGRVELGRGGAARADDDRRPTGRQAEPEGGERGRALVVEHVQAQLGPLGEGERQRRRPRSRADDDVDAGRPGPPRRPGWRRTSPPPRRAAAEGRAGSPPYRLPRCWSRSGPTSCARGATSASGASRRPSPASPGATT